MLIRCIWRDCEYRNKVWGANPMDALWVEATLEEAENEIFPRLPSAAIAASRELAEKHKGVAELMGNPARPFCFLVARDLSSIDPFHVHYPVHQLWGAYSPFREMPRVVITDLDEVRDIQLAERHVGCQHVDNS